jgi:hypothetical protein
MLCANFIPPHASQFEKSTHQPSARILCDSSVDYILTRRNDLLDLFFNPLLALLILFLECEIFDLGTASTIGGSNSSRDARPGIERYHAGVLSVERSIVDEGRDDRRND